jgi:hypothetical protein
VRDTTTKSLNRINLSRTVQSINHLRMPTPFLTMTKESIKTKSPVADFLTLWRERIEHPLQFHHHRMLLVFLPLPECQLNPTASASSTTSCLSCLPWPECQIKMSVGVMINHTRPKNKMSYMNKKHFCLQETQKTQCYILCWNRKHTKETHNCLKSKNSRHNLKLEQDVLEKGKGKMDTKIKAS